MTQQLATTLTPVLWGSTTVCRMVTQDQEGKTLQEREDVYVQDRMLRTLIIKYNSAGEEIERNTILYDSLGNPTASTVVYTQRSTS